MANCDDLKEQYIFSRKFLGCLEVLVQDSLIAPKKYDEALVKLQVVKA
ncbi:MAG: hypothetical protein ACMUEM_00615 [Flavobacteriales bacterium AspAUS03]